MRSVFATCLGLAVVSLLVALEGGAQERPAPTATTNDPRVGLKAGLRDAGEAAKNMKRIATLPKPEGFFDPKAPGGEPTPPERDPNLPPLDPNAPPDPRFANMLAFANSDLAFSGNHLFMGSFHGFNTYDIERPGKPKLSAQELKVLRLVAEGLTNPEIGTRLYLSRHTVKEYVSHAMRKLDATNRIEAVRKATALGLIEGTAPPSTGEGRQIRETLVYNDSGAPARSSDLKVTPLKIDKLETGSEGQ